MEAKYRCITEKPVDSKLGRMGYTLKEMPMKFGSIVLAIIGLSSSLLVCVPNVRRWQKKKMVAEKLRIVSEALEVAEDRVARYQERHDRILSQISAYYLTNIQLLEALEGTRASMNQALDFAVCLRRLQLNLIRSFPEALDLHFNHAFIQNASSRTN